ncbi:MAG: hypothetical protein WDN31_14405 [Hyphomicrobium sp.]
MENLSLLDGGIALAHSDGSQPKLVTAGSAAGEGGVRIAQVSFHDGAHYASAAADHLVFFHLSAPTRINCRVAGEAFVHEARVGAIGICPAGADTVCRGDGAIENLVVSIDPGALALAAAEDNAPGAQIMRRPSGEDHKLYELARTPGCRKRRRISQRGALLERRGSQLHQQLSFEAHIERRNAHAQRTV